MAYQQGNRKSAIQCIHKINKPIKKKRYIPRSRVQNTYITISSIKFT